MLNGHAPIPLYAQAVGQRRRSTKDDNRHGLKGCIALSAVGTAAYSLSLPYEVRRCDPVLQFGRILCAVDPQTM